MSKLPTNKKLKLLGLVAVTSAILALLWFVVIVSRRIQIAARKTEIKSREEAVVAARKNAALYVKIKEELEQAQARLGTVEETMVRGDAYRWVIRAFRDLQSRHEVEFTDFEPPRGYDLDFFPKLPYKAYSFTVEGIGLYEQWGLALADFERTFPTCRLHHFTMEPAASRSNEPKDAQKLQVRMEFIALVKPESTDLQ